MLFKYIEGYSWLLKIIGRFSAIGRVTASAALRRVAELREKEIGQQEKKKQRRRKDKIDTEAQKNDRFVEKEGEKRGKRPKNDTK